MLQKLSVRTNPRNANHHLWNNNGIWWINFTVHLDNYQKKRIRVSLETKDEVEARFRRDLILINFEANGATYTRFRDKDVLGAETENHQEWVQKLIALYA
jgi:hypothetical protein